MGTPLSISRLQRSERQPPETERGEGNRHRAPVFRGGSLQRALAGGLLACVIFQSPGQAGIEQASGGELRPDPAKLYLGEHDCADLDDSLRQVLESRPSRRHFLMILRSLQTHWEARKRGVIARDCDAINILHSATTRYFSRLGETVDPPWPPGLVGPLLTQFLLSESSEFNSWGFPKTLADGGYLRVVVPGAGPAWSGIARELGPKLPFPLLIAATEPSGGSAPTPKHPELRVRVSRYADDYYDVVFHIDSGDNETLSFGAICHYVGDHLRIITLDWNSKWRP